MPFSRNPNPCPFKLFFPSCRMWQLYVWFFMIFSITLESDGYMFGTSWLYGTLWIMIMEGIGNEFVCSMYYGNAKFDCPLQSLGSTVPCSIGHLCMCRNACQAFWASFAFCVTSCDCASNCVPNLVGTHAIHAHCTLAYELGPSKPECPYVDSQFKMTWYC